MNKRVYHSSNIMLESNWLIICLVRGSNIQGAWRNEWTTAGMNERANERTIDWTADRSQWTDWPTAWLTDRDWLTDYMNEWTRACMEKWQTGIVAILHANGTCGLLIIIREVAFTVVSFHITYISHIGLCLRLRKQALVVNFMDWWVWFQANLWPEHLFSLRSSETPGTNVPFSYHL